MKTNTPLKRLLSLLIVLCLVFTPFLIKAEAEAEAVTKIEAVFAQLGVSGEPSRVFIVNHFDVPEAQAFVDYGDYISISRLNDLGTIEADGDTYKINSEAGRFYYQGEIEDATLPWTFTVEATLDEEPVLLPELSGKDGALALSIEVKKTPGQELFSDFFALQIMVSLPFEHATQVTAEKGTIAMAGDSNTVTFMALPGQEDVFQVKANVSAFQMPGIQISAVPLNYDVELDSFLGSSEEFDFQQLFDAVDQLAEGSAELKTAGEEITTGLSDFVDGIDKLVDGGSDLVSGAEGLRGGVAEFGDGLNAYMGGIGNVTYASRQLASGVSELGGGLRTLANNGQALIDGAAGVKQGLTALSEALGGSDAAPVDVGEAVTSLVNGSSEVKNGLNTLSGGLTELAGGFSELTTQGQNILAGLSNVPETAPPALGAADFAAMFQIDQETAQTEPFASMLYMLAEQSAAISQNVAALIQVKAGLSSYVGGIGQVNESLQPLQSGLATLAGEYATLDAGIQALATELSALGEAGSRIGELKAGIGELVAGQQQLEDGLTQYVQGVKNAAYGVNRTGDKPGLAAGMAQLRDGLSRLNNEGGKLKDGATELASGSRRLRDGVADYVDGVKQVQGGTGELRDGLLAYVDGVTSLADGMQEFKEGVDDLDTEVEARIKEEIAAMLGTDYEPVSFADPRNKNVASIQFIFMTDAINGD